MFLIFSTIFCYKWVNPKNRTKIRHPAFLLYTIFTTKNIIKRGECLMENSIYHPKTVYNCLKQLNLCRIFPHTVIKHIPAVLLAVFSHGYKGKTINFQDYSTCHCTTIAHFLNKGNWDSTGLEDILKDSTGRLLSWESRYSVLWMIPQPLRQSLRHGLCIRLRTHISTSPI